MNIVMTEDNAHNIRFRQIELGILTKENKIVIDYDPKQMEATIGEGKVILNNKKKEGQ